MLAHLLRDRLSIALVAIDGLLLMVSRAVVIHEVLLGSTVIAGQDVLVMLVVLVGIRQDDVVIVVAQHPSAPISLMMVMVVHGPPVIDRIVRIMLLVLMMMRVRQAGRWIYRKLKKTNQSIDPFQVCGH